jgi:hypothetical protein
VTISERADGALIRSISARAMRRKERSVHEQAIQAGFYSGESQNDVDSESNIS